MQCPHPKKIPRAVVKYCTVLPQPLDGRRVQGQRDEEGESRRWVMEVWGMGWGGTERLSKCLSLDAPL